MVKLEKKYYNRYALHANQGSIPDWLKMAIVEALTKKK